MTTAARASSENDTESLPRAAKAAEKRTSVATPKPRATRAPKNKPRVTTSLAKTDSAQSALVLTPRRRETQLGTLLMGAGLGAVVTLSVMALGNRVSKSAAFRGAVAKSVALAVASTSSRGSVINLLARAVGGALA